MKIKYSLEVDDKIIINTLVRITNLIYKLLPLREEGIDWIKPLETVMVELTGFYNLCIGKRETLFLVICKMEGLFSLQEEKDFFLFRRTILDCLGLLDNIVTECRTKL